MDFSYSEEQQMLRDSVSRYLVKNYDFDARQNLVQSEAPWSGDVWIQFAELGLLALPFPEEAGGLGGSIADVVAIAEIFGEHLLVEPYHGAILMSGSVLAASPPDKMHDQLEKLVAGEAIVAFAYEEGKGSPSPEHISCQAVKDGEDYVLNGEKRLVLAGAQADRLVVVARRSDSDALVLLLVDPASDGVETTSLSMIDGRSAAHIKFTDVSVRSDNVLMDDAGATIDVIINHATIALCAEAVGAMGALLRITSEYAATRQQFGRPIVSFQAVAHRLADMKIAYTKARSTLLYTTALAEAGQTSARDISVLKGQTGKLGREIGEAAIQTHGGVGMTDELSVGHYHKRLLAIDAMLGGSEYHLRKVGQGG